MVGKPVMRRAEAYLSSVPGGLAGYPECHAKGVLVRMLGAEPAYAAAAARLPKPYLSMLRDLPMNSEWIPEVHYLALLYALADAAGQSEEALISAAGQRSRRMFESSAYHILMAAQSPAALLRGAAQRWANWHRGSTLEVEGIADDGVRVRLLFPPGLFSGPVLGIFGGAFQAALELSQARAPRTELVEAGVGHALYRLSW